MQELLKPVADILRVDTVAILLLEGDALHARAAKGIEEEVERGVRIPVGRGLAGRIAAERPSSTSTTPTSSTRSCARRASAPCSASRCSSKAASSASCTPAASPPASSATTAATILQLTADRAALAIEQARAYELRRVAEALQRRRLPDEIVPAGSGLEADARYLPAAGGNLGSDWYDVFPLSGGRMAVAVGDVVGHGVESAAAMAQLRTAVRAYAADGHGPAAVVGRVNR